jgi:hypothetical protein
MLAECAQVKNGLLYLLGAGWEYFDFPTVPFEAHWPLACIIDTGSIEPGSTLAFRVTVKDPTGFRVLEVPFSAVCGTGLVSASCRIVPLSFSRSEMGVWTISIASDVGVHSSLAVEVKGADGLAEGVGSQDPLAAE